MKSILMALVVVMCNTFTFDPLIEYITGQSIFSTKLNIALSLVGAFVWLIVLNKPITHFLNHGTRK